MPQARFFCRTGGLAGSDHRIGAEATVGRGDGNSIVLPAGVVSKRHARIVFDEAAGAYTLEDLRSRNGTHLDGRPVESRVRLGALHVITFGERHDFFFVAPPERAPGAAAGERSNDEASPPLDAPRRPERAKTARSTDVSAVGRADAAETRIGAPGALQAPPFEEAAAGGAGADAADATSADPPTALDAPPVVAAPPLAGGAIAAAPPDPPPTALDAPPVVAAPPLAGGSIAAAPPDPPPTALDAPPVVAAPPLAGGPIAAAPPDPPPTALDAPPVVAAPPLAGGPIAAAPPDPPPTALDAPPVVAAPRLAERSTPGEPEAGPGAPATVADPPSLLSAPPMTETPAPPAARAPVAVVLALPGGGRRRIDLADGRHVVGRGSDCAIRVDDRMLSREHAAFVVRGDAVTVEDLNSMNGTTFDERPVSDPVPVPLGRKVTFGGRIEAVVTSDDQA